MSTALVLSAVIEVPRFGSDSYYEDAARHLVEAFSTARCASETNGRHHRITCPGFVRGAEEALRAAAQGAASLNDFTRPLQPLLLETRDHRAATSVPGTLAALEREWSFRSWQRIDLEHSRVKLGPRTLYLAPDGGRIVAEIPDADHFHETEILVRRSNTPGYDFYIYGLDGVVTLKSEFFGEFTTPPAVCMSCHYVPQDRTFLPLTLP